MNEQFLIHDIPLRQTLEQQHNGTSNTTTTTVNNTGSTSMAVKTVSASQRTLSKTNTRKKSFRNIIEQQISKIHHDEDTLEFTQLENIKHINGLPRVRFFSD
jgi:hypothetical protein